MDTNQMKALTDYIFEISRQNHSDFQFVITLLLGTILAGVFVAGAKSGSTSRPTLCQIFWVGLSFLLFVACIWGVFQKHQARKDFTLRWLAVNLPAGHDDSQTNYAALAKRFTTEYYSYTAPDDLNSHRRAERNHESRETANAIGDWAQSKSGNAVIWLLGVVAGIIFIWRSGQGQVPANEAKPTN